MSKFLFPFFVFSLGWFNYSLHAQISDTISTSGSKAQALMKEVAALKAAQDYEPALAKATQARELWEATEGRVSNNVADALHQMGELLFYLRKTEKAVEKFEEALGIRKETTPLDDPNVTSLYQNLAICYNQLFQYDKTIEIANSLLEVRIKSAGLISLEVADVYNILGNAYGALSKFQESLKAHRKALDIKLEAIPEDTTRLARSYNSVGYAYYLLTAYDSSILFYEQGLELLLQQYGEAHPFVPTIYSNIGSSFDAKGDPPVAITYYERALAIRLKEPRKSLYWLSIIYNNLGTSHSYLSDYEASLYYHKEALLLKKQLYKKDHPDLAASYNNIGDTYFWMDSLDKSITYLELAVETQLNTAGKQGNVLYVFYNNLGKSYAAANLPQKALANFQSALVAQQQTLKDNHPTYAITYGNLGSAYIQAKEFEKAALYLQKAEEVVLNNHGNIHPSLARIYRHFSKIYKAQGNMELAEHFLEKSLFANDFKNNTYNRVRSIEYAFNTLEAAIELNLELYQTTRNPKKLKLAEDYSDQALGLLAYHQKTYAVDAFWRKRYAYVFQQAVQVAFLKKEAEPAEVAAPALFTLFEKGKSSFLRSQIQSSEALQFASLPDSLLQEEYQLRIDITFYEKKLKGKLDQGLLERDTQVLAIESKLFGLKTKYDQLIQYFERTYPDYYKLKYDLSTISLAEVQQSLEPDEALIEYLVGDSVVYIFAVTQSEFFTYEKTLDFSLNQIVQQLVDHISLERPKVSDLRRYEKAAYRLYQLLIEPIATKLPKKWLIIPDGILGYVPFDALVKETSTSSKPRELSYVLKDSVQISYHYSATLRSVLQERTIKEDPRGNVLAMAPFSLADTFAIHQLYEGLQWIRPNRADLHESLPHTAVELDSIQAIFKTDAFYGKEATSGRFLALAPYYRILHLATHAFANSKTSKYAHLVFVPQRDSLPNSLLFVNDIYNLPINAELVVLSACSSGVGQVQLGEGIISLARAFIYAGAQSVVNTLWNVDDISSSEIMPLFYRYLEAGMTKDQALLHAKLTYLDRHAGYDALPYHWAPFTAIGEMKQIKME